MYRVVVSYENLGEGGARSNVVGIMCSPNPVIELGLIFLIVCVSVIYLLLKKIMSYLTRNKS